MTIRPMQAKAFETAGCRWLHIVDLNGAFAGHPVNASVVEAILKAVKIPVQLGGGIRDIATIERWLDLGISRVILGTLAVRAPAVVREACRRFEGQVAVGIDARDGRVAVEGWAEESDIAPPISPGNSRMPARRRSSTPISSATACRPASMSPRRSRWRMP